MHDRLERLRKKLAAADDPEERADLAAAIAALEGEQIKISLCRARRADLAAAIAALEEKLGIVASPPAGDTITVGAITNSQAIAVGAGAQATVYIDGRQGKSNDELKEQRDRRNSLVAPLFQVAQ